jgi:outer membrane protein TolC
MKTRAVKHKMKIRILAIKMLSVLAVTGSPDAGWAQAVPESKCAAANAFQPISLTDAVVQSLSNEPHLIIARLDVVESKADLKAAKTPFLPKAQLIFDNERFVPSGAAAPVTVVGNNILGGTGAYSAYGSIGVSWNIISSGRDMAGYRGAKAEVRSSNAALQSQLDDTLSELLKGYADVFETRLNVDQQSRALDSLRDIEGRADERYRHGNGTAIAIGQARAAALDAERTLNQTCRTLTEKSVALAKAIGVRLPAGQLLLATSRLPDASSAGLSPADAEAAVESDPAVISAKEKVTVAEEKLKQARAAYGPSVSIDARRDYLGQDADSLSGANHTIGPNSYRVGVSFIQPIFPFTSEASAVDKARAELRRAETLADQARMEVDSKLRTTMSAKVEVESSYRAAQSSFTAAQQIFELTESLYKAGRTDLDSLEHSRMDLEKIQVDLLTLASQRAVANWDVERALLSARFAPAFLHQLGIEFSDVLPN